ncbi:MAG: hypothetical protein JWM35_1047 [Verrucomicrobia bacterium]|nr:hypothetical protein [Verrucomicrobiota bacterium]
MKSITRYLIPAAGLIAAMSALRADDPSSSEKKDLRVIVGPDAPFHHGRVMRMNGMHEKEIVTFLGIETRPADSTLAEQLNLPHGAGLIVRDIVADSPAASVLKTNDVLVKLDDQLLVEQRQLSVLIRNHKEGDEVALTFVRSGKENTAKVKLAKHEVPKMAFMEHFPHVGAFNLGNDDENAELPGMDRDDMDRVLALMDQGGGPGQRVHRIHIDRGDKPGMSNVTVNTGNSNMVYSDEKGSLDLTIKDGKKSLVAKNAKGEQIFSGPVTSPDERKALPTDVRERLDKLEGMQEFSFQTDDDFQGGRVEVVKPGKTKIALPLDPATPAPHRSHPF